MILPLNEKEFDLYPRHFPSRAQKSGRYWAAQVPLLLVFTQGKTKKEACEMLKDAIEELVEDSKFSINYSLSNDGHIHISAKDSAKLMGFALRQQRLLKGLSVREVAKRMGFNSPNAYSRYENSKVPNPSLDKFSQLLKAIDNELEPILKIG